MLIVKRGIHRLVDISNYILPSRAVGSISKIWFIINLTKEEKMMMMNVLLLALFLKRLLLVHGDYTCLCSYTVELPIHTLPDTASPAIGYIYEFDCKPLWGDESLYKGTTFAMIQFEKKVNRWLCYTMLYPYNTSFPILNPYPSPPLRTEIIIYDTWLHCKSEMKVWTIEPQRTYKYM